MTSSQPSKMPIFIPVLALFLSALVALGIFNPARADAGPKPSMKFEFVPETGTPVTIVDGMLLECQDAACQDYTVLETVGPQRFICTRNDCSSMSYGYSEYQRIIIHFSDGKTRQSNVFQKKYFDARYQVTVRQDDLLVEERRGAMNPMGIVVIASLILVFVASLLLVALLALVGIWVVKAGQEKSSYQDAPKMYIASWLVALPILIGGSTLSLALPVTIVIEVILALAYARIRKRSALPLLTLVMLANLITQPALWLALTAVNSSLSWPVTLFSEVIICLAEATILYLAQRRSFSWQEALTLGFILNVSSFAIGLMLQISL